MNKYLNASEKCAKSFPFVVTTLKNCWKNNGKVKLIFTAFGIFLSFVCVGIFQEKIMKSCYGDEDDRNGECKHGERFRYAVTLVLVKTFFGLFFVLGKVIKLHVFINIIFK